MAKGRNIAENYTIRKSDWYGGVCVFLSHINIDKPIVTQIADYIMNAGFDIYLDINDTALQIAVLLEDPVKITQCIEKGILNSTHMLCVVSENTVQSWWVPYEIGYGKCSDKDIATLTLKNTVTIPDYLKIGQVLLGTKSLNEYLRSIWNNKILQKSTYSYSSLNIINESTANHPLDNYLNWNK